jgi:hypothetical protein
VATTKPRRKSATIEPKTIPVFFLGGGGVAKKKETVTISLGLVQRAYFGASETHKHGATPICEDALQGSFLPVGDLLGSPDVVQGIQVLFHGNVDNEVTQVVAPPVL